MKLKYLLLSIVAFPVIEIIILLLSGKVIGFWPTLFALILMGIAGAYLAKKQGLETLRRAQAQMNVGQLPGNEMINGLCIMIGGILLVLPGFITDLAGLLLILPPTRKLCKPLLMRWITKKINKNKNKGIITIIQ
ncbi:membrane protein FxsA [Peribacillus psychrosaccharolyticus]|uniref:Membrane protein FxsA n=1 Tax=Peribacillus psychrosaccharolyticus TaxID=1407 RepID=A0A974NKT8_PERPY|nr:FxsA family protein [Peribacillus psychrosaccharolyticus]MEC2054696.1 membrane protein FxsA [Peribacillus psychrosaccharolyticus]MED3744077.1 membrane protein FxsA [Peribacillus psychrosaccharolyticus]QQS99571.1 membrane protein FxsA [Peribacillus psychrosaccharolyticus]